jgi:hypothetical protein
MSTAAAAPENCANCEAPLSGHFCSNCGQEAVLHHASTREFLHEFVGHYVALEGKLWGSLVRLMFRPGLLTNEYMRGRRVRFVQPLRLYLSFSLLFFVLVKFSGHSASDDDLDPVEEPAAKVSVLKQASKKIDPEAAESAATAEAAIAQMQREQKSSVNAHPPSARPAPATPDSVVEPDVKDNSQRRMANDQVDRWLADRGLDTLRHKWSAISHMSNEQQKDALESGFYRYAPYAIFCLMPFFALYLKILYLGSGRRFGEHVLFALHTNAFAFLMFTLMLVIPVGFIDFLLWCWLLGYLPWAMRRVYHSSRGGTFMRWAVLMFFYSISVAVALSFAAALGVATAH